MALLPLTAQVQNPSAGELRAAIYYVVADQDYEIVSVSVSPDSVSVASGTFSAFVGKVLGGSSTLGSRGLVINPVNPLAPSQIGNILEGWLQDPTDPSGQGFYSVRLLSLTAMNIDWFQPEDRPLLKRTEVLAILVLNETNTNGGTVVVQVVGRPRTYPH